MRLQAVASWGLPLTLVLALITTNPLMTMGVAVSFWSIALITWRLDEFPALTLACFMHWAAAAMGTIRADVLGIDLAKTSYFPHVVEATALTLASVTAFALAARIGWGWRPRPVAGAPLDDPGLDRRMFIAWLVASTVGTFLLGVSPAGLAQVMRSVIVLKWVLVLLIFYVALRRGRDYRLLAGVLLVEVASGFLSFISSFRTPLFLLVVAFAVVRRERNNVQRWLGAAVLGMVIVALGAIWQSIKGDYRMYLSGGTGAQSASAGITRGSGAAKVVDLASGVGDRGVGAALDDLALRIAYVDFFAAAMSYVPAVRPHENGGRLKIAFMHVLTPRLLFPKKKTLNDTADTERYTGIPLARTAGYTSVCLGYPAEAYVDGGRSLMVLPILLLGCLFGLMARRFATSCVDPLLGQAMAAVAFVQFATLELSFTKMLGGYAMTAIVFEAASRFVAPRLSPWLWSRKPTTAGSTARAIRTA